MVPYVLTWLSENKTLLGLAAGASLLIFFASLFIIPAIIVRISPDYFAHERRPPSRWAQRSAPVRILLLILKNTLGVVLVLVGMVMLGLPGQGLLTMLVGVFLINFPGKYRFERWLVSRRAINRPINWLRRRARREPLRLA
jgi:hypothetical protein